MEDEIALFQKLGVCRAIAETLYSHGVHPNELTAHQFKKDAVPIREQLTLPRQLLMVDSMYLEKIRFLSEP